MCLVEEDIVLRSSEHVSECARCLVELEEAGVSETLDADLYGYLCQKIRNNIDTARSLRPRWAQAHLKKAQAFEVMGRLGEPESSARDSYEQALLSYERALELDIGLWYEVEQALDSLRRRFSSMACFFYAKLSAGCIFDSVAVDLGGRPCFVSACSDSNCYVCDRVTGRFLLILKGHDRPVTSLELSQDKRLVISGSVDNTARVWSTDQMEKMINNSIISLESNLPTISPILTLIGHENRINCIVCTPCNSKVITSSVDGTLRLWDLMNGDCLNKMSGHTSLVSSIALSSCGKVCASASGDTVCRLWKIPEAICFEEIAWESGPVVLCDFISFPLHGQYLMTAHAQMVQQEARILLWDVFDKETGWVDGKLSAPTMSIDGLRGKPISCDTTLVQEGEFESLVILACSCSDGMVHVWDITDSPIKMESFNVVERTMSVPDDIPAWNASSLKHASNKHNLVKFSPSGKFLAATRTDSCSILVWDVDNGTCVCQFYGHNKTIRKIIWDTDYKVISFSEDGSIRGWKIKDVLPA